MVFSSIVFLCAFLPIVFILYSIIPSLKARNILLLISSIIFYAYGEPVYVILLILSSIINYLSAIGVSKSNIKKPVLALSIILNLGMLGVFKYAGFAVTSINDIFNAAIPVPQIELPIGISFFTFQAMSYVIDVYRYKVNAQKNYFKVLLYLSFFPQLIAGPIIKYRDIELQIDNREFNSSNVWAGMRRFIVGLGKKVIIANTMAGAADAVFSSSAGEINFAVAWLGAIAYMLQIYYDFSGYSDMAIGMGKMFGFNLKENFMYPYGAGSVKEFWRRWHISLSSWFKEYLYIPLGGNRRGKVRTSINKIIVFACTGLWHGANWTFIIWGLFHGAFLLFEDAVRDKIKVPKIIKHIYTLVVVCVGFVIFRADSIAQAGLMIKQMFTGFSFDANQTAAFLAQLTPWFIVILIAGIIGAAPIRPLTERLRGLLAVQQGKGSQVVSIITSVLCVLLLAWCIMRLSGNTYNPFIYFRF